MIKRIAAFFLVLCAFFSVNADDSWPDFSSDGIQKIIRRGPNPQSAEIIVRGYAYRVVYSAAQEGPFAKDLFLVSGDDGDYYDLENIQTTLMPQYVRDSVDFDLPQGFDLQNIGICTFDLTINGTVSALKFAIARRKVDPWPMSFNIEQATELFNFNDVIVENCRYRLVFSSDAYTHWSREKVNEFRAKGISELQKEYVARLDGSHVKDLSPMFFEASGLPGAENGMFWEFPKAYNMRGQWFAVSRIELPFTEE